MNVIKFRSCMCLKVPRRPIVLSVESDIFPEGVGTLYSGHIIKVRGKFE